jgi:hypothetical protein
VELFATATSITRFFTRFARDHAETALSSNFFGSDITARIVSLSACM